MPRIDYKIFRDIVFYMLIDKNIEYNEEYTKALYSQALLETGRFESQSYKMGKNLFGMKQSKRRTRFWMGVLFHHASYSTICYSILDRIDWDIYHKIKFETFAQYAKDVQFVGYAEDPNYIEKWQNIYLKK